jgi:hypothetical protein
VFIGGLGFHLGDGLDFTLKDQETFMVEIDSALTKQSSDSRKVRLFAVHVIFAGVVLKRLARDNQLGIWYNFMLSTWEIIDFLEINLDFTEWKVWVTGGIVDQSRYLALSHLASSKSKDKQQRIDNVRFSGSVRADDGGERSVERPYYLFSCVTLEVIEN